MKNKVLRVLSTVLVLGIAATGCGKAEEEKVTKNASQIVEEKSTGENVRVITMATSGQVRPFTYYDDDENLTGYDVEVAKAVFDRLPQYKLEISPVELTAVTTTVQSGRAQFAGNFLNWNEERDELYDFSSPITDCKYIAVFPENKNTTNEIDSLDELGGLTTRVVPGSNEATVLDKFNEENPDNPINLQYSDDINFAKVLDDVETGLLDFGLSVEVVYDIYQESYSAPVKSVPFSDELTNQLMGGAPYSYFVFADTEDELLGEVNVVLKELALDGTLSKISEQFFGKDYAPVKYYEGNE